jgi:DNA replication protein DnaC
MLRLRREQTMMATMPIPPTDNFVPDLACQVCRDSGWEPVGNAVRPCKGEAGISCAWKDRQRGLAPGVPVDMVKATLDTFERTADNSDAIKQAQYFLDGIHPGLYLHGSVGTGKTRLACSLLNQLWAHGTSVRFKRCPELLVQLQPGHDDTDQVWDRMVTVPVLVLDDVGANQGTDFARRQLQTIYDARLDRGHRTIWTSNLSLDDLGEFLNDDRLPSRIMGQCKVVELNGRDWRLKRRRAAAK